MSDINITIEDTPIDVDINATTSIDTTNINVDSTQCPVQSVNGKIGFVNLTYEDLGFPSGVATSGDLNNYYLKSNPSGFITSQNVVFTTGGTQNIGGYVNFTGDLYYNSGRVATLNDIAYTQGQIYSYTKFVEIGNPEAPSWQQFYIVRWTNAWSGQITIPTNYKIVEYRLNSLQVKSPLEAPWATALTNIELPSYANPDTIVRIRANGITGVNSVWALNIYTQTGILQTIDSTNPINKRYLEFIYRNNSWDLNTPPYHLHSKSEIYDLEPIPDIENGYFYRSQNAINRGSYMGMACCQVVLASDTRLSDPRPVRYRYIQDNIPITPNPTGAYTGIVGDMAYDGANLYILLPEPGGQSLKWGRVAVPINWI